MPEKLDRPSLENPVASLAAGIPVDPADEPLDSLTEQWVQGIAALTQAKMTPHKASLQSIEPLPATQGEASEFVDRRLREAYGI
jgi:hypothetical protein